MEKTIVTIKGIDKNLWLKFRAMCVVKGQTVGDKLNELMKQATKRRKED